VVAVAAAVGLGGNVWLLAQESRRRVRTGRHNTRALRWLAVTCTFVVLGTLVVARPWYWDLVVAAGVLASLGGVLGCLRALWRRPRPARWTSLVVAAVAVLSGVVLLVLAGVAAVLDGVALSGDEPVPAYHGGGVLAQPVVYQLFWGPSWLRPQPRPALREAVAFARSLASSHWAAAIVSAGFGVSSVTSGGCWVDVTPVRRVGRPITTMASGAFPAEIKAALTGRHRLVPCPGSTDVVPPRSLPPGALVALWLPTDVPYRLGGVAAHGVVAWPGRPAGLPATGLPGAYADWGLANCAHEPSCAALPAYAAPTYALSHEVVETITDPYGRGWFADPPLAWTARYVLAHGPPSLFGVPPVYQGEVSDLCQPGEPTARGRRLIGRDGPGGTPVSPFFRPGRGCGT